MTASINGCLYKCSVLQSGFEDCLKRHWLGANYDRPGTLRPELNKLLEAKLNHTKEELN